jgi:hypothetical protein
MASQPLETPEQVALQHARRQSETAWGKGYQPPAKPDPRGEAAYTNIGSHERVPPSPAKVAMREAGRKGLPAPNGPKGMNAPSARKPPTLPRGR